MQPRKRKKSADRSTVAYVRVSTEHQSAEGVSLEAQEARLRAYAAAMGWELAEVVVDAAQSAKSTERPGLQRIISGIAAGTIGRVVVVKLDRLTRSVRDLADLLDVFTAANTALVSIGEHLDTTTAAGRLMLNLLASVSQWEREAIGERTATALGHKREQRAAYGPTPFGYRRDGDRLVAIPELQTVLAEMKRRDVAGESFRKIGAWLTTQGVRPSRGSIWHAASVRAVLRSRMAQEAA